MGDRVSCAATQEQALSLRPFHGGWFMAPTQQTPLFSLFIVPTPGPTTPVFRSAEARDAVQSYTDPGSPTR